MGILNSELDIERKRVASLEDKVDELKKENKHLKYKAEAYEELWSQLKRHKEIFTQK
jgi:predicted  nucleic acid-binding Zn-ribbon protein